MQTITSVNEKGGVGKTTISVTIAAGLANRGARVLVIDADPQGHASLQLNTAKGPGLYDLLVRGAAWKDVVRVVAPEVYEHPQKPSKGQLVVLPSNIETRNIAGAIEDVFEIGNRLQELDDVFDYAFIDTSPTPSLLHGAIYLATDKAIYPTTVEAFGFDGLSESIRHREQAAEARAKYGLSAIGVLGIIPNLYIHSTLEHRENLEDLQQQFGDLVWKPIPRSTIWAEVSRVRKSVWAFAPNSKATKEADELVEQAIARMTYASA